jgi:hypothetical protein
MLLVSGAVDAHERPFGPGDGPNPLIDIGVDPEVRVVQAPGGVEDFVVWEKSKRLFYRDESDELTSIDLRSGDIDDFASMERPISRVVDPSESVVVESGMGRVFRALQRVWHWFIHVKQMPMRHLFWNGNKLYSIGQVATESGAEFHLFSYDRDDEYAQEICHPFQLTTGEESEQLKVAEGSSFPDVYIYKSQYIDVNAGYTLWLRHYNLSDCTLSNWYIYRKDLPGAARAVFWFKPLDAFAVSLDDPKLNLLWQSPQGHYYFHLDSTAVPVLPNPGQPVLALFDVGQGIRLIYPAEAKRKVIYGTGSFGTLNESTLWLTADGKRLYIAPIALAGHRALLELGLSSSE